MRSDAPSDRIQAQHRRHKAFLDVRESSAERAAHDPESRKLPYGMEERSRLLGRSEIEVVDEDLRPSADGGPQRTVFERMAAEVCPAESRADLGLRALAVRPGPPRMDQSPPRG